MQEAAPGVSLHRVWCTWVQLTKPDKAGDFVWCSLPLLPYSLEQWVPYLCTARGFWTLCQSYSGRATKKSDKENRLREGISKIEHKQPFTLCMEKPCKSKKRSSCLSPPAWVYWHGPELLLWLKSSLSVGSHVPCYEMYPLLLVSSRYVAYRVWNNGLHCWQPVLREGEMGRGARTSCLPPDSPMQQHEKKKKSNEKKQKEKEKCQRKNRKRSQVRGHSHKWRNCRQSGFVRCWSA